MLDDVGDGGVAGRRLVDRRRGDEPAGDQRQQRPVGRVGHVEQEAQTRLGAPQRLAGVGDTVALEQAAPDHRRAQADVAGVEQPLVGLPEALQQLFVAVVPPDLPGLGRAETAWRRTIVVIDRRWSGSHSLSGSRKARYSPEAFQSEAQRESCRCGPGQVSMTFSRESLAEATSTTRLSSGSQSPEGISSSQSVSVWVRSRSSVSMKRRGDAGVPQTSETRGPGVGRGTSWSISVRSAAIAASWPGARVTRSWCSERAACAACSIRPARASARVGAGPQ